MTGGRFNTTEGPRLGPSPACWEPQTKAKWHFRRELRWERQTAAELNDWWLLWWGQSWLFIGREPWESFRFRAIGWITGAPLSDRESRRVVGFVKVESAELNVDDINQPVNRSIAGVGWFTWLQPSIRSPGVKGDTDGCDTDNDRRTIDHLLSPDNRLSVSELFNWS